MSDKNEKTKDEQKTKKEIKVSGNLQKLIDEIGKLSVIELADLVKALEEKFGVTAAAPLAAPVPVNTPQGDEEKATEGGPPEGQTTFNVVLTTPGESKISVIKMVREINQTLGLKEAKDLVESTPKEVITGVNKTDAEEAKKKLEKAGATVELK